ncbi:MAG: hypothetical protein HKP58_10800, partial [Desulfatitalea sp.]|nr:hypothetical protein [Desulfatitalea sp.]NNK00888.1 hypothetical protein [Desulfatitalea sp.]
MNSIAVYLAMSAMVLFSGCTPMLPKHPGPTARTYKAKVDLRLNGFKRTYRIHLPPDYTGHTPLPLVVVVHGAFYTAKEMEKTSGFTSLADA